MTRVLGPTDGAAGDTTWYKEPVAPIPRPRGEPATLWRAGVATSRRNVR